MFHSNKKQDSKYIHAMSERARSLMKKHMIAPSPINYQMWYDYVSKENLGLNKTIDDIIARQKPFSPDVNNNLYEKFYSNNQEQHAVTNAGKGLQTELIRIAKTVSDINNNASEYGNSLKKNLQGIDNIPGGVELKSIISGLLTDTNAVTNNNLAIQKQLQESSKTVQKLQNSLEIARRESLTDTLTNIGNRKAFEENIQKLITQSNQKESDFCLIIGDIDHFKKFNDTWGHHVGDQVLRMVAHALHTQIGDNGTTTRYGGEEFAILMPGLTLSKAMTVADKLCQSISARPMKRKSTGESIGKISCSFGVAQYRHGEHRNDILERADAALYQSKINGRNQATAEEAGDQKITKIA